MLFPASFTLFHHTILWHVAIEPLAMLTGFRYYLYLRKKKGDAIESENRARIILGAIFGAIAGSRLVGGLENIPQMLHASNKWLYFYQNKTVLGGFLGGIAGVEIVKKIISEKQNSGDLFVYPMLLALIIGRIGCFSMGVYEDTYGTPTTFITGMHLGDGLLRHPVALYEMFFLLLLWKLLAYIQKDYRLANGLLFKLFIIVYCIFRFLLDYIKPHFNIAGLSVIQITSLAGLLYYLLMFFTSKNVFSWSKKNTRLYA